MTDAHSTLTRATTASRKSTIASRNASLIKKNTGPYELRPSDILIERFSGTLSGRHVGVSMLTHCRLEAHHQAAHCLLRGYRRH